MTAGSGALVVVGTPIGNLGDLAPRAVEELRQADTIAAEDTRRTRKLLTHAGIAAGPRLVAVHEHNEAGMAARLVDEIRTGRRIVYVTDAGMPSVSDPGARLVRACVEAGLRVEVVPGPSAALAALVISGFPADRFVFEGFLPPKGRRRADALVALAREDRTIVLFESPHRLAGTLEELADALGRDRAVVVARELTKLHEETWRGRLGEAASAAGASPRGEYVVVIAPAPELRPPLADDAIVAALEGLLDEGMSTRDAATGVARELGVPKRRVYALATQIRNERRG